MDTTPTTGTSSSARDLDPIPVGGSASGPAGPDDPPPRAFEPVADYPRSDVGTVVIRYDAFYLGVFFFISLLGLAFLLGRQSVGGDVYASRPLVLDTGSGGLADGDDPEDAGAAAPDDELQVPDPDPQAAAGGESDAAAATGASPGAGTAGGGAAGTQGLAPRQADAGAWYIQCMHTSNEADARAAVAFLQSEGLTAFLKPSGRRRPTVYLVAVGPFSGQPRDVYDRVRGLSFRGAHRFRDAFFFSY